MRNILLITALGLGLLGAASGQENPNSSATPPANAAGQTDANAVQPGSLIYAELSKSIDSKKAKVGDPVVAKAMQAVLSHGKIVIPKNTKIIGHLTSAQARTKDQPRATLGIAFDRAELKGGEQVPLTAARIQALGGMSAPNLNQPPSNADNGSADMGPGGGGMTGARSGGMTSPMSGPTYSPPRADTPSTQNPQGSNPGNDRLNASSRGVIGMPGVELQSGANDSTVSADQKNIKLDSGMQMVLRVSQ